MPSWLRRLGNALAALSLSAAMPTAFRAGSDIGIVVLHGKQAIDGDRPTVPLRAT